MTVYLTIQPGADPSDYNESDNLLAQDWSQAKHIMMLGVVEYLRLPYWLGTCEACKTEEKIRIAEEANATANKTMEAIVDEVFSKKPRASRKSPPLGCEHAGTGLDFMKWLDATGFWMVGEGASGGVDYVSNGNGDEIASIYDYANERAERLGIAAE